MPTATSTATIADIISAYAAARVQNARVVQALAAEHRIGATDLRAMVFLAGQTEATPKQTAEYLGLTTGAMTTLIDRIEQAGLVRRAPHPTDRRSLVLAVTPEGKDLVAETSKVYADAFDAALTGADLDQVLVAFRAVSVALQTIADERAAPAGAAAD